MITLEQGMRLLQIRDERKTLRRGLAIYHPLTSVLTTLPTGQTVTFVGAGYGAGTYQGISCVTFPSDRQNYFILPYERNVYTPRKFALSVWMAKTCTATSKSVSMITFGNTYSENTQRYLRWFVSKRSASSSNTVAGIYNARLADVYTILENADTDWHSIIVNGTAGRGSSACEMTLDLYIDGAKVDTLEYATTQGALYNWTVIDIGSYNGSESGFIAYAALRVWDRQLTAAEIATLASEFTPQTT